MTRRRKKHSKDAYLDPEYAALAQHLEDEDIARNTKKGKKNMSLQLPYSLSGQSGTKSNYSWQGNSNNNTYSSHDHDGKTVVWESSDGKKLYGGNGRGVSEYSGAWDLIIDLASNIREQDPYGFVKGTSDKRFDGLRQFTYQPKKIPSQVLSLAWPDMQPPPCTLAFWLHLWATLPEKTMAFCIGGHGRTGTCLAALMIASGEIDFYSAVEHVRAKHCQKAVETIPQELYLHKMYMELLERNLQHETDPKVVQTLKEDLLFAKTHVPNQHSMYGGEPEKKTVEVQSKSTHSSSVSIKPTLAELDNKKNECVKLIGDVLYELSCRWPNCLKGDLCMDNDHLGWAVAKFEKAH